MTPERKEPYVTCGPETICQTLNERLEESNAKRKGFACYVVISFSTGDQRCIGVGYRTSAKDSPLMLNFCPWCGKTPMRPQVDS